MTTETASKCEESPKEQVGENKCNHNPNNDLKQASSDQQKGQMDKNDQSSQTTPNKSNVQQNISPSKSKNKRKRNSNQRKHVTSSKNDRNDKREFSKSPTVSPSPPPTSLKELPVLAKPTANRESMNKTTAPDVNLDKRSGSSQDTNSWRRRQADKEKSRDHRDLKDQLTAHSSQIQSLVEQVSKQMSKARDLEIALLSTTKTCNQLDRLLQQEIITRTRLETENETLNQTVSRLKSQLTAHEKSRAQNDELMRVLNATLMERETEVSILKLKLTRLQTNPSSKLTLNSTTSVNLVRQDPSYVFTSSGRSNSEFDRNSYIRSSMAAEAASARSSTTHLKSNDRDACIWATVPEELTPSKRPLILEKAFQPIYHEPNYDYDLMKPLGDAHSFTRDRRYKTLPRSMKSPTLEREIKETGKSTNDEPEALHDQSSRCQVTNLDDSNGTDQNSSNNSHKEVLKQQTQIVAETIILKPNSSSDHIETKTISAKQQRDNSSNEINSSHYSTLSKAAISSKGNISQKSDTAKSNIPHSPTVLRPTTPIKLSNGLKKIFEKFRRSGSSNSKTDLTSIVTPTRSTFKRGANRSTLIGTSSIIHSQMSPMRQAMNFQTDKPFAEWNTDMLVDWLTMIGLSMYSQQCRRWVKCGAHIMNATPAEVDKGLGITNHLHQKKLRLAISELNGDCDKITKAASKLDYLWVARWLDDIGLPQYKEAFINARVDGRVLNYLTVEDLLSLGVKSVLHHASIKCGIKVLRSIEFDLQLLKRRATSGEVEQMNLTRQKLNQAMSNSECDPQNRTSLTCIESHLEVPLWTCHRVMEWLRMIDFAEFAPNLRGSGVHGGLIVFEDGFNIDTICTLLSIPTGRTLLRRHLTTFFDDLIGEELAQRKRQFLDCQDKSQLNPTAEIKAPKKSQWLNKFRGPKVAQDCMDDYLCPMYPVEQQLIKATMRKNSQKSDNQLANISESAQD